MKDELKTEVNLLYDDAITELKLLYAYVYDRYKSDECLRLMSTLECLRQSLIILKRSQKLFNDDEQFSLALD